jgi:hypothetical protein
MACVGFEPVEDTAAQVLILGTLPSTKSLKLGEYYAKKPTASGASWEISSEPFPRWLIRTGSTY